MSWHLRFGWQCCRHHHSQSARVHCAIRSSSNSILKCLEGKWQNYNSKTKSPADSIDCQFQAIQLLKEVRWSRRIFAFGECLFLCVLLAQCTWKQFTFKTLEWLLSTRLCIYRNILPLFSTYPSSQTVWNANNMHKWMIMMTQSAQMIRVNVLCRNTLIAHAVMIKRNAKK